jgi:hypothetical protein
MLARFGLFVAASAALLLSLAGCGGAGGGTGGGSQMGGFKLTIKWPTADRHIPSLTTRMHMSIDQGAGPLPGTDIDVAKPADGTVSSIVVFKDLPTGVPLNFHARAFGKQTDTSPEELLGTVDDSVTLTKGVDNIVVLGLQTTIDHLTATSPEFEGSVLTVAPGQSTQLNIDAHPFDEESTFIPFDHSKLNYVITGGTTFTVSETGVVKGIGFGTGTIDVTDLDSGKKTTVNVSVKSPVRSLTIGISNSLVIFNHQTVMIRPLIKALDKNGNVVTDAKYTYGITGTGLTVDSGTEALAADEGVVKGNGEIATGTLTVNVSDSTLSQTASISVQAHDVLKTMTLVTDSFLNVPVNTIQFNSLTDTVAVVVGPTGTLGDYELTGTDRFGNDCPIASTDLTWSVTAGTQGVFQITNEANGISFTCTKNDDPTAVTTLTIKHVSGIKLSVAASGGNSVG